MTPGEWFAKLLGLIGAPATNANVEICNEWARLEGMYNPGGLSFARGFNPWMTTWPAGDGIRRSGEDIGFGPGKWNNANPPYGVGMYATPEDGLRATVRTLEADARYTPIMRAFREQAYNPGLVSAWVTWIGSEGYANSLAGFAAEQWGSPANAPVVAVTRTEYEDLVLALFAGSEEHADTSPYAVRSRAERLAAAMHRVQLRAAGTERSVADIAASAAAVAPASIPDHRHEMSLVVAQTGGVKRS